LYRSNDIMNSRFFLPFFAACALTIGLTGCDGIGSTSNKPDEEGLGDSTVVSFVKLDEGTDMTVDRATGEFTIEVKIGDPGFAAHSVDVLVDESSTAVLGEDVDGLSKNTTITFPKSFTSGETRSITFDLLDLETPTGGEKRRRTLDLSLSVPDTVNISVDESSFALTIEEWLTTQEARSPSVDGKRILVDGTVTRVTMDGAYLQDDQGALFLDGSGVPGEVAQGDRIRVDGSTGYQGGLLQLSNVDFEKTDVLSQGNQLPEAQPVTLDTLSTDGKVFESELVRVQTPFTIDDGGDDAFQETTYSIENSSIPLRIAPGSGLVGRSIPAPLASFQGVVTQSNGGGDGAVTPDDGYQLLGVDTTDVQSAKFTIAEAREKGTGSTVVIEGTVTRAFGSYARIQDESGPTGASGIMIRQTGGDNADAFQQDISDENIQPGTTLRVTGATSAFNGLLQINNDDLTSYEITGQESPPEPQTVSLADLEAPNGEDYESELVRIEGLSFPDASGTFEGGTTYTVEEGGGMTFEFRVQGDDETNIVSEPIPDETFNYEGVVGQFNDAGFVNDPDEGYQLIPVQPSDLQQ